MDHAVADLRGGAPGARPPYGPKFSLFHAVFQKIWENNRSAPPPGRVGAPSYGESWIRPWDVLLFLWMTLRDVQVYSLHDENVVEIWREFVGYDLDLNLTPIISSPDVLVSNGNNDYSELLDGNLATCVHLNQTWCDVAVKVKQACVQHFSTEFLSFVALSIIPYFTVQLAI